MIRHALLLIALIFAGVLAPPEATRAQSGSLGIAAVVNNDAVTAYDLRNRLNLVIATSNLPDEPQVRERILPQVLRTLIDERLKLQEAARLGIRIDDAEIRDRLRALERRNDMPPGGMKNFLVNSGIDPATLESRIRAELAWVEVIRRLYGPQVTISDREVDDAIARIERNAGKPEYLVSEIFLPIDTPADEPEIRRLADRLIQQIGEGASFAALAQNFSQSPTAAQGGDMGWVSSEALGDRLAGAVDNMSEGGLAGPIRTDEGFHILLLRDQRAAPGLPGPAPSNVEVTLYQMHLPLPPDATPAQQADVAERAKELAGTAENCEQFKEVAAQNGTSLSGSLGSVQLSQLPERLRVQVGRVPANETTEPMPTPEGIVVMMVCERKGDEATPAVLEERRERVRSALLNDRLEVRARQHLRNLRRQAFIDVRL